MAVCMGKFQNHVVSSGGFCSRVLWPRSVMADALYQIWTYCSFSRRSTVRKLLPRCMGRPHDKY